MGFFSRFWQQRQKKALQQQVDALRRTTVGDVMTTYVISIHPDDDLIKTATKMIAEDISCLVVMKNDELVGILSERDFMNKVPLNKKVFSMKVKNIMTPNVVTVPPDTPVTDAVALMKKKNFRRLVISENDKVVGIMTQTDLARKLADLFKVYPTMPIQDIMTKKVLTTTSKESFMKARAKMQKFNVGSILIEDKGEVKGLFTEYDIVMQFYDQEGQLHIREVSEFMRKFVRAAEPTLCIFEAVRLLLEKKMHRLPVSQDGKLAGIVTQTDIIRFIYCNLDKIHEATELKKFPSSLKFKSDFKSEHLKVYSMI